MNRASYPAIGALVCCAVLGAALLFWNPEAVRERYRRHASGALSAGDAGTALIAANRLVSLGGPRRDEALLLLAQASRTAGNEHDAAAILDLIAPVDRPVSAPAHLFLAADILSRGNAASGDLRVAQRQAANALSLDPHSSRAALLMGRAAARQRLWVEARRAYEQAAERDPAAIAELVPILRLLGDEAAAARWEERLQRR